MQSLFGKDYQNWISGIQSTLGPAALIFLIIAIALLGGFAITRICKLIHIPYVSGYIVLGILLGPSLLAFVPNELLTGGKIEGSSIAAAGFSFVSDLTMGFIAFGCGKYFKWSNIKSGGKMVIVSSTLTALTVGLVTGLISYLIYGIAFKKAAEYGLAPAFLFGACAACISPTATSSIIRQYKAKGPFVERTFQNILTANIVAILAFSIILGLTTSGVLGGIKNIPTNINAVYEGFKPLFSNIVFIALGILFAYILGKLNNYRRTNDSRIILTIAFTTTLVALCSIRYSSFNPHIPFSKISPLLPCMAFGIFYFNFSKSESLFFQLENFLPPILCLFFVISGAKLNLKMFEDYAIAIMAVIFILVRTGSQFMSTNGYGKIFSCPKTSKVYLPLTMFTMTSVAVGLITLASDILVSEPMITFVYTVILTACIVLEIIGPVFAKMALIRTDSADPAALMMLRNPKIAKSIQNGNNVSD